MGVHSHRKAFRIPIQGGAHDLSQLHDTRVGAAVHECRQAEEHATCDTRTDPQNEGHQERDRRGQSVSVANPPRAATAAIGWSSSITARWVTTTI